MCYILQLHTRIFTTKKEHFSRRVMAALACLFMLTANAASSHAQGFGILKIKGTFYHNHPPRVYLTGGSITVKVSSMNQISPALSEQMKVGLENSLQMNGPRLKPVEDSPDTIILCSITGIDTSSRWEDRTRSEYQATGSHTVHNEATNTDDTVTDYGFVDVPFRALVVSGRISVNYEIKDVKTGLVLDSDSFSSAYNRDFEEGSGAPDADTVYQDLVRSAVTNISYLINPHKQWVSVFLPKGKLKDASNFFRQGLWDRSLDMLEAMPEFKNPKDDAYRLYSLGVSYEAKAYTVSDPWLTKRYLEQAASNYKKATQLKPGEDIFWEPRHRAQQAVYDYQKLLDQIRAFDEKKKSTLEAHANARKPAQTGKAVDAKAAPIQVSALDGAPLTNDMIIDWVKAGTSEDYILASIRHSSAAKFDLSPQGRAKLIQAGVSKRIIQAMQISQRPRNRGISGRRTLALVITWLPFMVLRF